MSACAELILRFAQVNVRPMGEVKVNFLALLGNLHINKNVSANDARKSLFDQKEIKVWEQRL